MVSPQSSQYQAERFESAQAFLFHYEEHKDYDVLLLDIEMPGMDGVSMARAIRRENEAVQIAFITGYSDYIVISLRATMWPRACITTRSACANA